MEIKRTFDLLDRYQELFMKEDALAVKQNGKWVKFSTQQYIDYSYHFGLGLLASGFKKGDKIATISNNRPECNFIDMGMAMIGVVHVPLYTSLSCLEYENILRHSDARFVFISDNKLLLNLKPVIEKGGNVEGIYTFDSIENEKNWMELAEPKSVVLTQSVAHKYFGNENPLGQRLTLWNDLNVVVTGVTRDVPSNSSLRFDALISLSTFQLETKWDSICTTFVRVAKQANPETLERKFAGFSNQHSAVSKAFPQKMYLLPFADLNLNSRNVQGIWRQESQAVIFLTFTTQIK